MKSGRWFSLTIVATCTALVLSVAIATRLVAWYTDPFNKPGQTWELNGLLTGETIRLLSNGHFARRPWCDICPDELHLGTWTETDGLIMLQPEEHSNEPVIYFKRSKVDGCPALILATSQGRSRTKYEIPYFNSQNACSSQR